MEDGGRIRVAVLLQAQLYSLEGGNRSIPETRGGLGRPGTPALGRSWVFTPRRPCHLLAAGHKARRRLYTRRGMGRRPLRGPSRWLGLCLPGLLASAWAFAPGFVLC